MNELSSNETNFLYGLLAKAGDLETNTFSIDKSEFLKLTGLPQNCATTDRQALSQLMNNMASIQYVVPTENGDKNNNLFQKLECNFNTENPDNFTITVTLGDCWADFVKETKPSFSPLDLINSMPNFDADLSEEEEWKAVQELLKEQSWNSSRK